ncbi:hypothetical protein A8L44_11155 [Bacillus sp. FJAT-27986]|nr:kinase [Bacillus sp. FJAT-27986]OCA84918.1 hypothetical protein A8L44_11155 [Bacillus sp. FJAT-27986]
MGSMESNLIILRGNSGSGKTTIAKSIQDQLGKGTLLVSQDNVRREMLKVQDREGNLSIDLIRQIAEYGKGRCEHTIVEGILNKSRYGQMLNDLIQFYGGKAYIFYFDLSFEETVKRHLSRDKKEEFGVDALRKWWTPNDYLEVENEVKVTGHLTHTEIVDLILIQLQE